jgi:RNA polymerase sigma-70 factor (ECF subfamily)
VTSNTVIAEDVVQEVFTALWTDPDRFDPNRGSLRAFLGVQAYRRAVDAVRRDSRRRAREESVAMPDLGRDGMNGHDTIEAAALTEVVRDAIIRLPVEQRRAVELMFWNGLTCREVAHVLAIPEGTAKSRLRLAQSKLSEWLAPLNGEPV